MIKFVYKQERLVLFMLDKPINGRPHNPRIRVYTRWACIPKCFRLIAVPAPWLNAMYYRLKRGDAKLLCYTDDDGKELYAYGWVQSWKPFRARFRNFATEGTMLGPYWTSPLLRGQGLYGELLSESLCLCPPPSPAFIYAAPNNSASQRGILKAGFHELGEWESVLIFRHWSRLRRIR